MADPIRAALERLTGDIQEARDCIEDWGAYASEYFQQKHDLAGDLAAFDRKIAAARAALANSDGPAVPESREPAVVAADASDRELFQVAEQAAHIDQGGLADAWAEGYLLELSANEILEICRAVLARWGRPAPTDYRGVLPMIISETGGDDEPECERIICAAISGGSDYINNMPQNLVLERITPEGSSFARYDQTETWDDAVTAPTSAPL